MPSDDLKFVDAVEEWLPKIPSLVNEIGLQACLRATLFFDHASRKAVSSLLRDYLSTESDRHLSKLIHHKLNSHAEQLCDGYSLVVVGADKSADQASLADVNPEMLKAVRLGYFRALGLLFRLAKFRYQRPGAKSWHQAHSMLRYFHALEHQAHSMLRHFDLERPTDASAAAYDRSSDYFCEYLRIVCLALVPINNLAPQQIEFVARILAGTEDIQCSAVPDADTTHVIDLSTDVGPIPYKKDFWPTEGAILFFLSVSSLRTVVQKFEEALEKTLPLPREFADLPINRSQMVGVLSVLNKHWTNVQPNRVTERIVAIEAMRGALGFSPALSLVEITEQANGDVPVTDPHTALLNRLWQLEEKVEKHRLEDWTQIDGNEEGVGISIPMINAQHITGSLVSMRYADEPGWHLGIVRRVGLEKDGSARLGLMTFPGSPKAIQIEIAGDAASFSTAESPLRAIAFSPNNQQLLIPTGTFAEGLKINFEIDSTQRCVSLVHLIESGPDFELVQYADL